MAFTLANGTGLVNAFGILILIFLVCCCQMGKGCLQNSGKRDVRFPCWVSIIISTNNQVQEKQQFRDEAVKKLKPGEAVACVEKNIASLCISSLGLVFLEHFRAGVEGPLWGARF